MVLIEVRNSDRIMGRCDAKCYGAEFPGCICICGGANHGAGLKVAVENTREMAREWIEEYAKKNNLGSNYTSKILAKPVQLPLL